MKLLLLFISALLLLTSTQSIPTSFRHKGFSLEQVLKTDHYSEILNKGISQFIEKALANKEILNKDWSISNLKGFYTNAAAAFNYILDVELKNSQNQTLDVELEIVKPIGFRSLFKLKSYKIKSDVVNQ